MTARLAAPRLVQAPRVAAVRWGGREATSSRGDAGVVQPKLFLSSSRLLGTPVWASSLPSNSSEIQPR